MSRRGPQFARRDQNEPAIIEALEAQGFSVATIAMCGGGDLLVGKGKHFLRLVEVKSKDGKPTPRQIKFRETWSGPPPITIRSVEDALRFMVLAMEGGERCCWTLDADECGDSWDTACGEKYMFIEGGPVENKMRFCPYCAKGITEVIPVESSDQGSPERDV